jgi:hypothetical protein
LIFSRTDRLLLTTNTDNKIPAGERDFEEIARKGPPDIDKEWMKILEQIRIGDDFRNKNLKAVRNFNQFFYKILYLG